MTRLGNAIKQRDAAREAALLAGEKLNKMQARLLGCFYTAMYFSKCEMVQHALWCRFCAAAARYGHSYAATEVGIAWCLCEEGLPDWLPQCCLLSMLCKGLNVSG